MKDCRFLTKFEGAISFSYKVTIKSTDLELAKNEKIWPYRVGVRLFKHFTENQRRKDNIINNKQNNNDQRRLQNNSLRSNDLKHVRFVDEVDQNKYRK